MADNPPPTDWTLIFDKCKGSIVFVMVNPNRQQAVLRRHKARAALIKTVYPQKLRMDTCEKNVSSTGFIVASRDGNVYILTCLHGFEHIFKRSDHITRETLSELYGVTLICDHYEEEFRQTRGSRGERSYAPATIVDLDCDNDLLLLSVRESNLMQYVRKSWRCLRDHIGLAIAPTPREMTQCMMISWPSHMHRKIAYGHTSSSRHIAGISSPNCVGYDMTLLEVYMGSEDGSSGAPLLDPSGNVIGLLHGGFGKIHSYFVRAEHLMVFLQANGI